ncbi:MAG: tRNA threonylcarbamoyladenosine dehydratase [Clostridia bacterium]|nr:tRNA threonylcarbamoyladenosine dehydratase [Clostridia bacterium]
MNEEFSRTEMLLGASAMKRLGAARIAVFGLGGVGGYVVEALARCGVGELTLVDHDTVSVSNINRQIIALHSTVGLYKADVWARRVADISPGTKADARRVFFGKDNADSFDLARYDYVVDAIDTVTNKLILICACRDAGTPIISSMGAGNKLDPKGFEVADVYSTSFCPLARVMRKELKKRGVDRLKVVYSKEEPAARRADAQEPERAGSDDGTAAPRRKDVPGSISFVPSAAGLVIASEVVRDLCMGVKDD